MNKIAIQISPEAKAAYFADYLSVARSELIEVLGEISPAHRKIGPLEFFELEPGNHDLAKILRLSFAQGLYAIEDELLRPLDATPDFRLHADFVFGSKFRGKTNERLTQMLINVGLAAVGANAPDDVKLLDPMCGRATTLLWAMRYGITARGIEQDPGALADIHRHLKKWCKLHRQKHKLSQGFVGPANKQGLGKFLEFSAAESTMKVITGDARTANQLLNNEKFDLIISDLPYGVQHFTTGKTRNPLTVIEQCIEAWKNSLKKSGAIVLAYNRNNPRRNILIDVFAKSGLEARPFSAEHRMSESIVRDVVIFQKSSKTG